MAVLVYPESQKTKWKYNQNSFKNGNNNVHPKTCHSAYIFYKNWLEGRVLHNLSVS